MLTHHLSHFLTLADQLHFGRAAETSNISISALSRHIRQLEEQLGSTLFERDNRSVTLTTHGEKFRRYAIEAMQQWDSIRNELAEDSASLHGEISLYCSVTASHSILYKLLNRFREDFPGIDIKLHTGDPEHAISRVASGQEQLAIAAQPASLPRSVLFKPIVQSPLLFIAPTDTSKLGLANSTPGSAKEWARVPMILSEGGIARSRINAWFRQLGATPRIYAQVAGNEAIVSMVSLGLGIAVVPELVLLNSPFSDDIRILQVEPALEPYNVGLCTLKRNLSSPLVNAFWGLA